jgi:hypothetical protein
VTPFSALIRINVLTSLSLRFEFEEGIGENSAEGEGPEGFYGYAESVNFVRNGATDDAFTYYMMHRYSEEPTSDHSDDKFVAVDPHLLATPAMADINGDGHMEVSDVTPFSRPPL